MRQALGPHFTAKKRETHEGLSKECSALSFYMAERQKK